MKKLQFFILTFLVAVFISSCVAEKAISLETTKQIDTIIIFDPVTFEETIQIVESDRNSSKPKIIENYRIQVDTTITFDSDTYEETVQIVKKKVKIENN